MPVVPQLTEIPSVVRTNSKGTRPANWTLRDGYSPNYLIEDLNHWDYRFRYLNTTQWEEPKMCPPILN